jgi:hypothetical protein
MYGGCGMGLEKLDSVPAGRLLSHSITVSGAPSADRVPFLGMMGLVLCTVRCSTCQSIPKSG